MKRREPERHAVIVSSSEVARRLREGHLAFAIESRRSEPFPRLVIVEVTRPDEGAIVRRLRDRLENAGGKLAGWYHWEECAANDTDDMERPNDAKCDCGLTDVRRLLGLEDRKWISVRDPEGNE